jgi:hypothetical protein
MAEDLSERVERDALQGDAPGPAREGYWKWVIGGPYQGAVLRGGEIRHLHSSVAKEVFEQVRGTKTADVMAGLMFAVDIAEERSRLAFEELNRTQNELAAMTEDRDLWRYDHEGDCPVQALLEAERESRKQAEAALQKFMDTMAFTPSSVPGAIEKDLNDAYRAGQAYFESKPVQEPAERERGK